MAAKSTNINLRKASKAKKDEFYTQLIDIEKELKHYKEQLRGKIVYCNCDDPFESNFFKYFAANFNALGLKKLITTSYVNSPIVGGQLPLFEVEGLKPEGNEPFRIEINEVKDLDANGSVNLTDVELLLKRDANVAKPLKENGDFRSKECVELLKEADIIVTNPPFSLFREYIAQLVEYDKKFLIIGNLNAITYKEVFKLIKNNKIWLGYNNGAKTYQVPDSYEQNNIYVGEDGKKYAKMGNTGWYTNLDISKRHETLILYKKYNSEEYPKYFNYDAIEVSKVSDIPMDYDRAMGVPVSFLSKYNPEQFEIIGSSRELGKPMKEIAKKGTYVQGGPRFYLSNNNQTYRRLFDRLVIKKKK
jgi:hypothetical protein